MTVWEWITTTTSPDGWINTLGVATLAILFATNRILTRGQHADRVADLIAGYEKLLAEKDANHARELAAAAEHTERVDESRIEWKEAERISRDRAETATASVATMASSLDGIRHVLDALHEVAKETKQ